MLRIEKSNSSLVAFKDMTIGETFMYAEKYYIKLKSNTAFHTAYCFSSNDHYSFCNDTLVKRISITLNVAL